MTKLYHKEVFWPRNRVFRWEGKKLNLKFSRHALEACLSDRYGTIVPPKQIVFKESDAFEMELTNNVLINKIVIRFKLNDKFDISMVLILDGEDTAFVKTLWYNERTDAHDTLDKSKYDTNI